MANSLCFAPACSIKRRFVENSAIAGRVQTMKEGTCSIGSSKFRSLEVKAASDTNPTIKKTSLVCAECDGNGAKECSQCKGTGVNLVDTSMGSLRLVDYAGFVEAKRKSRAGIATGPAS